MEVALNLLESIRDAWERHDDECEKATHVLLLNPGNFEMLGWDEVLGLPVLPDPEVEPMRCRVVCGADGRAGELDGRPVMWVEGEPYLEEPEDSRPTA